MILPDPESEPEAVEIFGADANRLDELRSTRRDHLGNLVQSFIDENGGWPLRCCLADSEAGDELAIVAWSPFPWSGAYAEVGPIVIHSRDCAGRSGNGVPTQFLSRRQLVRPYGRDRRIAYDRIVIVEADGSLPAVLADLLTDGHIEFAHVRNVLSGCYSFTAQRAGA